MFLKHFKSWKSSILSTGILSTVGAIGFLLGKSSEKSKRDTSPIFPSNKHVPALPLFSTVSAAEISSMEKSPVQSFPSSGDKINRTSQIMKYGFPGLDNVRSFQNFVLSYDQRNRIAHWVFEHLRADQLKKNKNLSREKCDFKEDPSVHSYFRATNQDYRKSGYDRGHLAAAGNQRVCQEHVDETFYLTNIAPQVGPGFNRDAWNGLEKYVRKLARIHNNVYVCTGPLFLPMKESNGKTYVKYEVIGSNHVAVPSHFFKVIVMENDENNLEMESYVMPNTAIESGTPLNVFQVPPESIERASGLLFFNRLSRNRLKRINNKIL